MKKLLFFLIFAFAALDTQAQNGDLYSLLYRNTLEEDFVCDFIQQHNGEFIINNFLEEIENNAYFPLGNMFYKISNTNYTITDSLFVEDTNPLILLSHNTQGSGNIGVSFNYHEDCDSTFLNICHFTEDDFHVNHDEDVVVPICEGLVLDADGIVDCSGDIIIMYFKEKPGYIYDIYLARIDLDGTLKHQELFFENNMYGISSLKVLKELPLQYFVWKRTNDIPFNFIVYTIDSLFHKNPVILNTRLNEEIIYPNIPNVTVNETLSINGDTEVIPIGGNDILVAAQYVYDTTGHPMTEEYGVAVAKYDLRTMELKDYIVFNDFSGSNKTAECLGLKTMTDGTVYFIYKEDGYPAGGFVTVKMDTNLNVEWKRFCKTDDIILYPKLNHPILYKNEQGQEEGIAWIGYGKKTSCDNEGIICLFLNHDGTVSVNESNNIIRPYAFYPNPVKSKLQIQYSPDVQPTQIELYDLQGRLVCKQSKTFEFIDMSQLPTGTYTMRVCMQEGTAYSDKVVKE